jgi:hypothetical protein
VELWDPLLNDTEIPRDGPNVRVKAGPIPAPIIQKIQKLTFAIQLALSRVIGMIQWGNIGKLNQSCSALSNSIVINPVSSFCRPGNIAMVLHAIFEYFFRDLDMAAVHLSAIVGTLTGS